jgi:putative DNA primase/helicase
MTRRTLVCKIDPGVERPELREFAFDPIAKVAADRGRYIAAALTILRAYVVAGFPNKLKPLGSFEDWSNHVRSALVWLGETDPVDTMDGARESDPVLTNLRSVMTGWAEAIGHTEQVTASKLVTYANKTFQSGAFSGPVEYSHEILREALLTVASAGPTISTRSLGKWLKANSNRVVDGMRITIAHADSHNGARYRLEKVG